MQFFGVIKMMVSQIRDLRYTYCKSLELVEKVFFDKLSDCEKHTQTRKKPPSAYKGTVGGF